MSESQNPFVWYELMTGDRPAAETFYSGVLGWRTQDAGMPGQPYTLLSVGPTQIGGMMTLPPDVAAAGARPRWTGYIAVGDVDAVAARLVEAGGTIHRPATDIPGAGRFAVVADPHGAGFVLFKGSSDARPEQPAPGTPGHVGWHELHAGDGPGAYTFYSGLFGWTKGETIAMGAMGDYQLFEIDHVPTGGIMTKTPNMPAPTWLYYFNVDDIESAAARVTDQGGSVIFGPQEVPGGSVILQCVDPQGAMFALVRPQP